jgi:hypothetical protein
MRIGLRGIGAVDRLIASDPGLVQLRVASGKVLSLGMSLAVLYGFTKLAGQPFTVALLSVLIPMIASMAPLQQLVTAGLMLAVTGTAVTLGAWLVSDRVAGDVVVVVIIAATTFAQRCIATLIASLVGGNVVASLALIFVALSTGSYLGRVSYAVLIICVISMLALLFGLLGEFTIGLFLVRLEETAVGAAIGIGAAFLILLARTVTAARANIRSFLHRLADLVAMAGQ